MLNHIFLLRFVVYCCIVLWFQNAGAQSQQTDSIYINYIENHPTERLYVHFDKSYYLPGEEVWFKAYVVAANQPSVRSSSFYAELFSPDGKQVAIKALPIIGASAFGSFTLPANVKGGSFFFRGYTSAMVANDTSHLYTRRIPVLSANAPAVYPTHSKPVLAFFPEGGSLVSGLPGVLAFRAKDERGLPVKIKGSIYTSGQQPLQDFETTQNGMGKISFTPLAGETYYALWKDISGKEYRTELPAVAEQGIALQATHKNDSLFYTLSRTEDIAASQQNLHVIALLNNEIYYAADLSFKTRTRMRAAIPLGDAPPGLLQLVVFSNDWKPVAERITLVKKTAPQPLQIIAKEIDLNKRGKNLLTIQISDTAVYNLSVSITDAGISLPSGNGNIHTSMLLTEHLEEYVQDPAYYMENTPASGTALDLLMLTHAWRKYNWNKIAAGETKENKGANYITLTAGVPAKLKADKDTISVLLKAGAAQQLVDMAKQKDGYSTSGLIFFDSLAVLVDPNQLGLRKHSDIMFATELMKGLPKAVINNPPPEFIITDPEQLSAFLVHGDLYNKLKEANDKTLLQNVTVKAKQKTQMDQMDEKYARGGFRGGDAYSFDVLNDPRGQTATTVFDIIRGRLPGMRIFQSEEFPGEWDAEWRGNSVAFYINELPVDLSRMNDLNPADIAYIKVFHPPFFAPFSMDAGGAIAVYTRDGSEKREFDPGKLYTTYVKGYTTSKTFATTDYADPEKLNAPGIDLRTTLYWNPFVVLNKEKREIEIEFYNNDVAKEYIVVVEGITDEGKVVRVEKRVK